MRIRSVLMIVVGCALLLLALMLVLPVGVNLPASWFGVVIILVLVATAGWLLYKGVRTLLKPSGTDVEMKR
jgi:threonine/homoserine/homoserine lactone efflux protein